jgi:hypothetical protein
MGDKTSKNCYCKNNLELTFARRRWGSNTRKCRRAQSIKKEWEASDVGEKEREQSVDWEERKKEKMGRVWACVCLSSFAFLSFAASARSLQARRQLWSVERESGGSSRNGDGDRGKGGTDVLAGRWVTGEEGR